MSQADLIINAFASRHLIDLLSDADPSLDEAAAYAIAKEVADKRAARGEHPIGRKIGFTNRSIWSRYGVWAPIWGYIYDRTVRHAPEGHATVEVGHLLQPHIEPEVQLHFARTPPVTRDEEAILACVDWIAHGFELVQCPFPDWKFRAVDTIAACSLHGSLIVGPPVPVTNIEDCVSRLRDFTVTLSRNGKPEVTGGGASVLDSPLLAFAHLSEVLANQPTFPPVQAGELISTGTLTVPLPVAPGETFSTTIDGIDLPGLSVTIA